MVVQSVQWDLNQSFAEDGGRAARLLNCDLTILTAAEKLHNRFELASLSVVTDLSVRNELTGTDVRRRKATDGEREGVLIVRVGMSLSNTARLKMVLL